MLETQSWPLEPGSVDSHAHVFRHDLPMKPDRRHSPDFDALLPTYLGLLDAAGVARGVLVQPSFLGTDNRYLVEALQAAPDRLRGVAVVDPSFDAEALDVMARAGVCGIRLNLFGTPLPALASPPWQRLLALVVARGWHVEVHRPAADLPELLPTLLDAGCTVVVDHFGRPDPQLNEQDPGFQYLLQQAAQGQVWVKLAAAYRTWRPAGGNAGEHATRLAQALLASFGPERLVWGSDWPHTEHRPLADIALARQWLVDWVPDAAQRRQILVDSPAALFGF